MSSAARIFAVGVLTLAFAGVGNGALVYAEGDALTQEPRNQMAAAQGKFPPGNFPPSAFGGGGFQWGARPTFQPVGVASDHSKVAASSQRGQSFDFLAEPGRPAANGKSGANLRLMSDGPSYADDTAEAQPVAPDAELAGDSDGEGRAGPVNFPIGKSVKIKAQPLGGGLGGRVTFTFMLPTGD